MGAGRRALLAGLLGVLAAPSWGCAGPGRAAAPDPAASTGGTAGGAPVPMRIRGRIVCLAEELQAAYGAAVPPIHPHLWAVRESGSPPGASGPAWVLLRTPLAEGLFADQRLQGRELLVHGRIFPGTGACEVTRYESLGGREPRELYYWCAVCSIRGADPGPCACCQGSVELRESPGG